MSVRILDDTVIDRIAAGEVVERPASVLKELIENALDAGATRLDIDLEAGGVALVRVQDDGSGMGRGDAMLCIERHATSKITSADDLVGVVTHGFRGEALPSIASVSRFELRTRREEDELGTRVRVDGGSLVGVDSVACPVGTRIEVRSLFHHVPARRKFLRSKQTELSHCLEAIKRAVALRPDVDLRVRHDRRDVLRAPTTEALSTRVRDLLGDDARVMVPIDHVHGEVRVRGLVSPMGVSRSASTGSIYLFVGGRYVRDRVARRAITEAYQGLLPRGRHPIVVLDIEVPAERVDVNVHPAKTEVRFSDPVGVSRAVSEGVREAVRTGAVRVPGRRSRGEVEETPTDLPLLESVQTRPVAPAVPAHPDDDPLLAMRPNPPAAEAVPTAVAHEPVEGPTPPVPVETAGTPAHVPEPPVPVVAEPAPTPIRVLHLLPDDLALARQGQAWLLVDLRALCRARARRVLLDAPEARPLLAPAVVSVGSAAADLVDHADGLADLGLDIAAFGPGTLAIMAAPDVLALTDAEGLLHAAGAAAPEGQEALAEALAAHARVPTELEQARALVGHDLAPPVVRTLDGPTLRSLLDG